MRTAVSSQKALFLLALALFVSFFVSRSALVVLSALLLVGGGVAWIAEEKGRAWHYPLVKPWLIWLGAVALSILLAAPYEWRGPVGKLRYALLYFPLVYVFKKHPEFVRRLTPLAAGLAGVMGLVALCQYFGMPWSVLNDHPLSAVTGEPNHFHARGFMGHHTLFAFPMAMLFQFLFTAALFSPAGKRRWTATAGAGFAGLGLFASFSRGSWLAVLVASLVVVAIRFRKRALLPLVGLLAVVGIALAVNGGFRERFTKLSFAQNGDRVALWKSGLRMFKDSPWVGKGFHSYATYQKQYLTETEKRDYFYLPEDVHNFYLDLLCGTGILGLASFLLLLLCATRNLVGVWSRLLPGSEAQLVFFVALSTGIVAVLNNVTDSHFYSTYGGPIAIFFLALGQSLTKKSE